MLPQRLHQTPFLAEKSRLPVLSVIAHISQNQPIYHNQAPSPPLPSIPQSPTHHLPRSPLHSLANKPPNRSPLLLTTLLATNIPPSPLIIPQRSPLNTSPSSHERHILPKPLHLHRHQFLLLLPGPRSAF